MKDPSDDDDDESKPRKLNVFCLFAWPEMLIVSPLFFTSLCLAVSSSRHILTATNNFYNLYREPQRRRAFIFSTLELTKKKDFNELINNELHRKPSATPTGPLFAKHNTDIMYKKDSTQTEEVQHGIMSKQFSPSQQRLLWYKDSRTAAKKGKIEYKIFGKTNIFM